MASLPPCDPLASARRRRDAPPAVLHHVPGEQGREDAEGAPAQDRMELRPDQDHAEARQQRALHSVDGRFHMAFEHRREAVEPGGWPRWAVIRKAGRKDVEATGLLQHEHVQRSEPGVGEMRETLARRASIKL